jgi:glycosyltransferase involved in cell wall biosynthesis
LAKNIAIITDDYLCRTDGQKLSIGGVQRYNQALVELLDSAGHTIDIFQLSETSFVNNNIEHVNKVFGCGKSPKIMKKQFLALNSTYRSVIFSKYDRCFRTMIPSVAINHGIPFDGMLLSNKPLIRFAQKVRESLRKHVQPYIEKFYSTRVNKVVCVDTNFANYMRASFPHELHFWNEHLRYVPNFSDFLPDDVSMQKWDNIDGELVVIFPRRFEAIRGVQEWMNIVNRNSKILVDIKFLFIGSGSYRKKLNDTFPEENKQVEIKEIPQSEIRHIYDIAHIVVIPTICSEGTSLSAIEAMSRNCVVLATTIGGLGNLILSEYNGILCQPNERSIEKSFLSLIKNSDSLRRIAVAAGSTAESSFSRRLWEKNIKSVFNDAKIID